MSKQWTAQCSYAGYWSITVTVEAETLEKALEKALTVANGSEGWRSSDHCGDTFVDAVCEGAYADPWADGAALPIPDRFSEAGEPPVVTVTDPACPAGGIEVSRGRVLLRFRSDDGTVTTELRNPPHPPANMPLVTVRRGPDERPVVTVTEGQARVRILDE